MTDNYYKKDDVYRNSWFGFDYAFCGGDCANVKCGRNINSKSGIAMRKREHVYTCSDFTKDCKNYHKPKKVAVANDRDRITDTQEQPT